MCRAALAALFLVAACNSNDDPAPGSRAMYEPCEPSLSAEDELCSEGLVCQWYLASSTAYCAPGCSLESEDIYAQSPDCPEFDGYTSSCAKSPDLLACVIRCDTSCPEGLGLTCSDSGRCLAQDDP